jgi:hypothetical protein
MIMTTAAPTGEGSQELAHRTVQHVPRLWKAIVENREYPSLVWRVHLRLVKSVCGHLYSVTCIKSFFFSCRRKFHMNLTSFRRSPVL